MHDRIEAIMRVLARWLLPLVLAHVAIGFGSMVIVPSHPKVITAGAEVAGLGSLPFLLYYFLYGDLSFAAAHHPFFRPWLLTMLFLQFWHFDRVFTLVVTLSVPHVLLFWAFHLLAGMALGQYIILPMLRDMFRELMG